MADLPWEDFQTAPAKQSGPWDDFAPAKKTREQVIQEVGQAQARRDVENPPEEQSLLGRIAGSQFVGDVTAGINRLRPDTLVRDLAVGASDPQRFIGGNGGLAAPSPIDNPIISPEMAQELLKYSAIAPNDPNGVMAGVNRFAANTISGLSTPPAIAGMMSGAVSPAAPALMFAPPMVQDIPQATEGAVESFQGGKSGADRTEAILRLLGDVGFPLAMAKGAAEQAYPVPEKSGVVSESRRTAEDILDGRDYVGADRRLPEYAQSLTEKRINPEPTVLGPKEGEGRTIYRLPAQREPAGLLPEKSTETIRQEEAARMAQNPTPIDRTFEGTPVKAPDYILPKEQRPVRITEPVSEAAKIDETPTKLANPSDYEQYIDVQKKISEKIKNNEFDTPEFKQLWQENENIKNRNGGMPPKQEVAQANPTSGAEVSSGIGKGINAALERNKEAGSVPNIFKSIQDRAKKGGEEVVGKFSPLDKYEVEKAALGEAQGLGKVPGIGKLFDPRAKEKGSDVGQALNVHAHQLSRGEGQAAILLETAKNRFGKDIFKPAKKYGKVILDNGKQVYLGDAIESYLSGENVGFNAKQKEAIKFWTDNVRDPAAKWLKEEGVKTFSEDGRDTVEHNPTYFRRSALGRIDRPTDPSDVSHGIKVGSERSFQKGREYPSQAMGAHKGVVYDNDFYSVMGDYLKQVYRSVADERLANDPALKGEKEYKFNEKVALHHPAFAGKYFDPVAAAKVDKHFNNTPDSFGRAFDKLGSFVKQATFSGDIAGSMNQLLTMAFSHPVRWSKTVIAGIDGFVREGGLPKYLSKPENNKIANLLAKHGVDVVRLADLQSDLAKTGVPAEGQKKIVFQLNKILTNPGSFNTPIKWGNRAMGYQFAVGKIELAKATHYLVEKGKMTEQEWAEHVANTLGSAPTRSIGVTEARSRFERNLLGAPTYARAAANMMADALNPKGGRVSWEARKNLGSLATGVTLTTYVTLRAMQQAGVISEDDVKERMTPNNPKFLKIPIKVGDAVIETGYGNIYVSLARHAGGMFDKHKETGEQLRKFGTSRLAPIWGIIKELATGKDYKDDPIKWWEVLLHSVIPISTGPLTEEGGVTKPANSVAAALQFIGGNTSPESFGAKKKRREFEITKEKYGLKSTKELNTEQRGIVQNKASKMMEEEKDANSDKVALQAVTAQAERAKRIQSMLSPRAKMMLEENRLNVPQVQPVGRTIGKYYGKDGKLGELPVRLDRQELDNFEEQYAKELSKRLENIDKSGGKVNEKRFEVITKSVREMIINKSMSEVNKESRRRRGVE